MDADALRRIRSLELAQGGVEHELRELVVEQGRLGDRIEKMISEARIEKEVHRRLREARSVGLSLTTKLLGLVYLTVQIGVSITALWLAVNHH